MLDKSSASEYAISVIILNYNGRELLMDCIASVLRSQHNSFEVIIVDNGSTDGSIESINERFGSDPRIRTISLQTNNGIAEPSNIGIKKATGRYVVFLNNDTEVREDWLLELERVMEQDTMVGAAQSKLLSYYDRTVIDGAGVMLDLHGCPQERGGRYYLPGQFDRNQFENLSEIFAAAFPAMIVRENVLRETGLFDPKLFAYMEDVDLSWRIRLRGYKIVLASKSVVYHKRGQTSSKILHPEFWESTSWHFRKNRIAILVKNFEMKTLLTQLPFLVALYLMFLLDDLVILRDSRALVGSLRAVLWNLTHFREVARDRIIVQNTLRRISDHDLQKMMRKKCFLINDFVKPILTKRSVPSMGLGRSHTLRNIILS